MDVWGKNIFHFLKKKPSALTPLRRDRLFLGLPEPDPIPVERNESGRTSSGPLPDPFCLPCPEGEVREEEVFRLESSLVLWVEISDECFEEHFRFRHFGDQCISREQAIQIFRDLLRALMEERESKKDAVPATARGPASGAPAGPEADLTAPSAITQVDPRYPPELMREKIEGIVILYAIIGSDGAVDPASVQVVRKLDTRMDPFAREALLQWKFRPSRQNGDAVAIQAEISIPFYYQAGTPFRVR